MPKQLHASGAPLSRWLLKHDVTIAQLAEDLDLAYRTAWMATHGRRVSYETADRISKYTRGEVTVKALCSGKPRAEFQTGVT